MTWMALGAAAHSAVSAAINAAMLNAALRGEGMAPPEGIAPSVAVSPVAGRAEGRETAVRTPARPSAPIPGPTSRGGRVQTALPGERVRAAAA